MSEQANTVVAPSDVTEPKTEVTPTPNAETAPPVGAEPNAKSGEPEPEEVRDKRLGGWQRKQIRAEAEAAVYRELYLKAVGGKQPEPESKPAVQAEEPKPEDFATGDGNFDVARYTAALTKFHREQVAKELRDELAKERKQQTEGQRQQERKQKHLELVEVERKEHADFDDVAYNPDLPISQMMAETIVESPVGAKLAYWLGKNPDEAARIAGLGQIAQARELGRIEERIASQTPAEVRKDLPPQNPAPRPLTPVRKSAPVDDGELHDGLNPEEWARRYRKKMEKR